MYLTAHRVRATDGREGINAFRHLHGADLPWPADARTLPDRNPGREVDRRVEVIPGGNHVRAYLDVLAPDDIDWKLVKDALEVFRSNLDAQLNPAAFRMRGVTCLFGVEFALVTERAAQFDDLLARLAALVPELAP